MLGASGHGQVAEGDGTDGGNEVVKAAGWADRRAPCAVRGAVYRRALPATGIEVLMGGMTMVRVF